MASSDEEGEIFPEQITDYHFVDDKENPVSFAILPIQWSDGEILVEPETKVFISGNADSGLQKIYKSVIAWKVELSYVSPMVLVLTKHKKWLTLQKPRSSYRDLIRSIFITVYWLHFLKRNPEASSQSVRNHLKQAFSCYETEPSEDDLSHHLLLIQELVKRDEGLAKSKCVVSFLEEPSISEPSHQDPKKKVNSRFIVDEDDVSSDEDTELTSIFDTVCSICDNGGTLLSCEGSCLRSFHPTEADGSDSYCQSLGFLNSAQVDALPSFLCKNCLYKQHQCYACGGLGSSDTSSVQEVFSCSSATCGRFYHPECIARLLCADDKIAVVELQETIAAGKSFTCPMHKCHVCNQSEDATVIDLHLAICRRCPKAYHRKCLPEMITVEYTTENNLLQRTWDGLLPENRILMYCLDHLIIRGLGTPRRSHLKFPHLEDKEKKGKLDMLPGKEKIVDSGQNLSSNCFAANRLVKKRAEVFEKLDSGIVTYKETNAKKCSRQDVDTLKKPNLGDLGKIPLEKNFGSHIERRSKTKSLSKLYPAEGNIKPSQVSTKIKIKIKNSAQTLPIVKKARIQEPPSDIEKRISALMEESTSSFNIEEFMKRRQTPANYASNPCNSLDKTITFGRVEASVKAIRAALEKLEAGGSIDDAKTICGPEVIKQIFQWKGKLQVYLSPFLHGTRYTSYGRHFTKLEKLKEVVNRLGWYVQNGDTIVDFSCGSNDFSCLMKEKLDSMGKSCFFKNYDLFRPKNDFSFEQRDWMTIKLNELPDGGQLIMGLNPPFGVKASLANMFINKALEFRPKIVILIVPQETKRLDSKAPYDLIWEDNKVLAGKSFYLPGSVDVEDKQLEQWNLKSPPLYLWSRRDWTSRHKAIAQVQNHIYNEQERNSRETQRHNHISNEQQKNAKVAEEQNNAQERNAKESGFSFLMEDLPKKDYLMVDTKNGYGDFFNDMQQCLGLPGNGMSDGVARVSDDRQRVFPDLGDQGLETDMEIS